MVPVKGTFEWDFQHRFGTVKNGSKDLWGVYGPANIRMGFVMDAPRKKIIHWRRADKGTDASGCER